ncbi:hypothetical protein OQJ13_00505 [Legionella sp. PATHC035]|uniref:hypothetical protein n=1 Tax=Legionella sp. PATHC035 TaxID=2992040 RepID=UPI002243B65E|nr:hypothetical protein [Legionella sp. PATHC035]MCW8407452.1 hypothetical protein [Legionella sp. PATHC035]
MGKDAVPQDIRQNEINYICKVLNHNRITTTQDLIAHFDKLIKQIRLNPQIFKEEFTSEQCFQILKKAIATYCDVYAYKITLKEELMDKLVLARKKKITVETTTDSVEDDLTKVTKGYDRLEVVHQKLKEMNQEILRVMKDKEFAIVPQVIIGSGDTGTTLWLEKFKAHHGTYQAQLAKGELPSVLMIGEHSGSWKHDYTLAQPHSILERTTAKENPSIYLPSDYYRKNPHANGRHVYQANQATLGSTEAPLLRATVLMIEKRNNHMTDWKVPDQKYRLVVKTPDGVINIYTNQLNICTGLGPARNLLAGSLLRQDEFEILNQIDPRKGFTPVVDGNQFILSDTEEHGKEPRKIVIYGGGGTAAACYRKGFFGHDIRTEAMVFDKTNQKNSVIWIAKQFEKAGTGKLATTALSTAKSRGELMEAELIKIEPKPNGKLFLVFKKNDPKVPTFDIECDQLIYSVGQDDKVTRTICQEVETDLSLNYDKNGMVLNVSSADKDVMFFGAAAMAVREKEYMHATWKWLHSENIGGDVGPGSMPPTRAQIKCYNFWSGMNPTSINANIDSHQLIINYLAKAGIDETVVAHFVEDLLQARKSSTCGASHSIILDLLRKHKLDRMIEIKGHAHLVLKTMDGNPKAGKHDTGKSTSQLLSWLGTQRETEDASIFISSATAAKTSKDTVEKEEYNVQLITEIRS